MAQFSWTLKFIIALNKFIFFWIEKFRWKWEAYHILTQNIVHHQRFRRKNIFDFHYYWTWGCPFSMKYCNINLLWIFKSTVSVLNNFFFYRKKFRIANLLSMWVKRPNRLEMLRYLPIFFCYRVVKLRLPLLNMKECSAIFPYEERHVRWQLTLTK